VVSRAACVRRNGTAHSAPKRKKVTTHAALVLELRALCCGNMTMTRSLAPPCAVINRLGFLLNACESPSVCVCLRSYAADAAAANLTPFCALEFCCTQFAPSFTPWLYCYLLTYYVLTYTGCRYGTGLVVGAGEFTLQRG
jgi:hypothetical protein